MISQPKPVRSKILARTSSTYYGVSFHIQLQTWCAYITIAGDFIFLGSYKKEEHAAYAYNVAFKNFIEATYLIKNYVKLKSETKKEIRNKVFRCIARKNYPIRDDSDYIKKYEKLLDQFDVEYFQDNA